MNPYRLLYRLGITPWERAKVPPQVVDFSESFAEPGRALDLGCGTGRDAVFLAGRRWTVTGVDSVPRALDAARRRAAAAGVEVAWTLADVTRLPDSGIGDGYQLVLDRGCFHGLSEDERARCVAGLTAVTAPGARLLLFAFQPRKRGLGPRGITPAELERCFDGGRWTLTSSERDQWAKLARAIGDAKPIWYQLARSELARGA